MSPRSPAAAGTPRRGAAQDRLGHQHRDVPAPLWDQGPAAALGTRRGAGNTAKPCCTVGAALGSTGTTVGDMVTLSHLPITSWMPPQNHLFCPLSSE